MDVFVGWFKRAFVQSAARLVAQLYTGLTTFNFNKVNTDATDHTGFNNVYAAKDDDETVYKKRAIRTVTWIEPVTGRAVCNHYEYGSINNTPSASPPLAIEVTPIAPFVTVDGVYVANMNEGRTTGFFPGVPAPNAYPSGGVHIQKISGVDYIVGYQLRSVTNGFEIKKYKTILDMNIDQELITAMPYDKSVIYTEDSNFSNGGSIYHDDAENGSYELTLYIVTQSRSLTCNEDGTKTIFFAKRRSSGAIAWADAEYYPIFELTDTETVFEVNEILQYENLRPTPGSYTNIMTCGGGFTYTQVENREGCDNPPGTGTTATTTIAGTYTNSQSEESPDTSNTDFLGCSYDRYNDQPIIIFRRYGTSTTNLIMDYDITRGGSCSQDQGISDGSVNWNFSASCDVGMFSGATADSDQNELVISTIAGSEEVVASNNGGSMVASGTGSANNTTYNSYQLNIIATQSTSRFNLIEYQIVDLSSKIVVYEYHEEYADISLNTNTTNFANCIAPTDLAVSFLNADFTRRETFDRYYSYVNGTIQMIRDDINPGNLPSYFNGFNLQTSGTKTTTQSAGCEQPPVTDCDNPTKTCTTTESWTCP